MQAPQKMTLPVTVHLVILCVAMVLAGLLRLDVPSDLDPAYDEAPMALYAFIVGSVLIVQAVAYGFHRIGKQWRYVVLRQFRLLVVELVGICAFTLLFLPNLSGFQLLYFLIFALIPGGLVLVIPARLGISLFSHEQLETWLKNLIGARFLLRLWMSYRIRSRYAQTFLGILWIILVPLSQAALFSFVFGTLFGIRTFDVPFISFFFSGLTIFMIFQNVVNKSVYALTSHKGLIEKVYFPREIAVLLLTSEVIIDFIFTFAALLVVNAIYGIFPNIYYVFLPIPIVLMVLMATGVGLIVSWLNLIIRDLQQISAILVQFSFYLTVLFAGTRVPERFKFMEKLNPLSAIVEAFRDIMIYEHAPSVGTLAYPALLSLTLLYAGYTIFKVNEEKIVDLL